MSKTDNSGGRSITHFGDLGMALHVCDYDTGQTVISVDQTVPNRASLVAKLRAVLDEYESELP